MVKAPSPPRTPTAIATAKESTRTLRLVRDLVRFSMRLASEVPGQLAQRVVESAVSEIHRHHDPEFGRVVESRGVGAEPCRLQQQVVAARQPRGSGKVQLAAVVLAAALGGEVVTT